MKHWLVTASILGYGKTLAAQRSHAATYFAVIVTAPNKAMAIPAAIEACSQIAPCSHLSCRRLHPNEEHLLYSTPALPYLTPHVPFGPPVAPLTATSGPITTAAVETTDGNDGREKE